MKVGNISKLCDRNFGDILSLVFRVNYSFLNLLFSPISTERTVNGFFKRPISPVSVVGIHFLKSAVPSWARLRPWKIWLQSEQFCFNFWPVSWRSCENGSSLKGFGQKSGLNIVKCVILLLICHLYVNVMEDFRIKLFKNTLCLGCKIVIWIMHVKQFTRRYYP